MLTIRPASRRAHLRSHSGHNAGVVLSHAPTAPEYIVPPNLFRVLLLERLLPLPVTEARCTGCHEPLDPRAPPCVPLQPNGCARICREGGAHVRFNVYLRDMNVHVHPEDERHIEVLAQDLPCFGGAQLAVDITLGSALGNSGEPRPHAADVDGVVLVQGIDKETPLVASTRCLLVVVAIERGGRWSDEAVHFGQLAQAKARDAPRFLAHQVALAWERRWTRMLSVACASSFAMSLVEPMTRESSCQMGGELPTTAEILLHNPRQGVRCD